jgi:hypothetical protein
VGTYSQNKSTARPKNLQDRAQHARLVFEMMKGELTAHEIKAPHRKWQRRAIRAQPGDFGRLEASLSLHAERPIEAGTPGMWQRDAVGDQLVSGAAADAQNRQIGRCALFGKRIRRARPVRLRVVKIGDLVVVYPREAPHRAPFARQDRLLTGVAHIQPPGNSGAVLAVAGGGNRKILDLATQARVMHLIFRDGVEQDERIICGEAAGLAHFSSPAAKRNPD